MIMYSARIEARLEALSMLRRSLRRTLAELSIPTEAVGAVQLVVSEFGSNAILHAERPASEVAITLTLSGTRLRIDIEDDGTPFAAWDSALRAALRGTCAEDAEHGRGLLLLARELTILSYRAGPPNRFSGWLSLRSRRARILVVEDSEALLATYSAVLSTRYEVVSAASLAEAARVIEGTPIDGVVADLHLGGDQGTALVDCLDGRPAGGIVPVLVVTGESDAELRHALLGYGIDRVLRKPLAPAALLEAVDAMLLRCVRQSVRQARAFAAALGRGEVIPSRLAGLDVAVAAGTSALGRGDFVFALPRPRGCRLVLGDVMGHGVPAQAAAIAFVTALRSCHRLDPDAGPGRFTSIVSALFHAEAPVSDALVTFVTADLDEDGRVAISAAGHPAPLLLGACGAKNVPVAGPLAGLFPDHSYGEYRLQLAPGERLVLGTDGLDPTGPGDAVPDAPWLLECVEELLAAGPIEGGAMLKGRLNRLLGDPPPDDWTLLVLSRPRRDAQPETGPALA
jgi:CheY-like chemotaxis protein/anti-sigma regulatory factor (Ser/Thr protein kinase)